MINVIHHKNAHLNQKIYDRFNINFNFFQNFKLTGSKTINFKTIKKYHLQFLDQEEIFIFILKNIHHDISQYLKLVSDNNFKIQLKMIYSIYNDDTTFLADIKYLKSSDQETLILKDITLAYLYRMLEDTSKEHIHLVRLSRTDQNIGKDASHILSKTFNDNGQHRISLFYQNRILNFH